MIDADVARQPKVAVLLAAYNGRRWIAEQLDTILAQRGVEVTLFISIDPSTDGTAAYLHERAKTDTRIKILPELAPSGCAARNFYRLICDVNLHSFEFISLADQDDCWNTKKLARACEIIQRNGVEAYSSDVTAFWPSGREKKLEKAQPQQELDFLFEAAGPGCTYVFEQQFALALQQFLNRYRAEVDTIIAHDWLFYAFCRSHGYQWFIDTISLIRYRQHGRNELGANSGVAGALRRLRLLRSGWYRSQAEQIAATCGMMNNPLVAELLAQGWRGRLAVVQHINKLRRRVRDRFLLVLFSLLGLF
ncbi:MAG: glycosyl transferase family 2 [Desulfuromonas sp.]|nr:glycosyl transferase family 2 [Desulfuromonas sp.]